MLNAELTLILDCKQGQKWDKISALASFGPGGPPPLYIYIYIYKVVVGRLYAVYIFIIILFFGLFCSSSLHFLILNTAKAVILWNTFTIKITIKNNCDL